MGGAVCLFYGLSIIRILIDDRLPQIILWLSAGYHSRRDKGQKKKQVFQWDDLVCKRICKIILMPHRFSSKIVL
jgi:hypothetical protein